MRRRASARFCFLCSSLLSLVLQARLDAAGEADLRISPALEETFQTNQRNWPLLTTGQNWDAAIEGGVLRWANKTTDGYQGSTLAVPLSARRPYEISVDVAHEESSQGRGAGLQWGVPEDFTSWNFAMIDAAGRFTVARYENKTEQVLGTADASSLLIPHAATRLTVRFFGSRMVVFVNGAVVWIGETPATPGPRLGVIALPGVTARFDNLNVKHLRAEEAVFAERLSAYQAALGKAETFLSVPSPVQAHVASTISAEMLAKMESDGYSLHQAGRFREAEALFRKIIAQQPEYSYAHVQLSWCLLNSGELTPARNHAVIAAAIDPLGLAAQALSAYAAAAAGDDAAMKQHLAQFVLSDFDGASRSALEKDLEILATNGLSTVVAQKLRPELTALYAKPSDDYRAVFSALIRGNEAAAAGNSSALQATATEAVTAADALPSRWKYLTPWIANQVGMLVFNDRHPRESLPFLERAYTDFRAADAHPAPYLRAHNAAMLADAALFTSNAERAAAVLASEVEAAMALPVYASRLKADILHSLSKASGELRRNEDQRRYAARLLQVTGTGRDPWYHAWAHHHRGTSFSETSLPPEVQDMKASLERALAICNEHGFDELASSATSNLALAYWKLGDKARARETYLSAATKDETRKDFAGAEVSLNNLGAIHYYNREYGEAADAFRKAVALTERARAELGPEERVRFLAKRLSAYQFLIGSLHHAGNGPELFEAENALRGRTLAETLNLGTPAAPPSHADFQKSLGADEAAIFYSVVGSAEIVAHVVTRESSRSAYRDGRPLILPLKQRYLDRLHAKRPGYKPVRETTSIGGATYASQDLTKQISTEDFESCVELYRTLIDDPTMPADVRSQLLPEFRAFLSQLLIDPIVAMLAGKKRLLIFPDGILYFVPFEALSGGTSQHLVEKFDVRYAQSAAVLSTLRSRRYDEARAPFLGMGGALYSDMVEQAPPLADATRQVQLQIQARRNIEAGSSQREVYAALFGNEAMKYLKGSLIEVQELGKLFQPAAIFTGEQMTENRLKQMSRDGSLAKYRIIHLATHGFSVPEVPEMSGIAMTITPQAEGGEDGYLNAPEIARLGMRADLAVLSACDTGLGRIYGGEGVVGLTSSLLIGGANRALVSLWPVSDAGTMRFMREMYALTEQEGVSYDVAINRVKRRFIAGDFGAAFQDTRIWAPFIHYGP